MKKKQMLFHQDNAPCHKSIVIMAKLHELYFELLPHQPYSPDLAPSVYYSRDSFIETTPIRMDLVKRDAVGAPT